jgi:excisionase family DNA binding protein
MNNEQSKLVIIDEATLDRMLRKCVQSEIQKLQIPKQPEKDKILFVEDAAYFLGLSKQTVYSYTSQGLIPFYKRAKKIYFKQSELQEWLESGRYKTQDEINKEASDR